MTTINTSNNWLLRIENVVIVVYIGLTAGGYATSEGDRIFILAVISLFLARLVYNLVRHWAKPRDPMRVAGTLLAGAVQMENALAPYMRWTQAYCLEYRPTGWVVFMLWGDEKSPTGLTYCRRRLDKVLEVIDNEETLSPLTFGPGHTYYMIYEQEEL